MIRRRSTWKSVLVHATLITVTVVTLPVRATPTA